MTTLELGKHCDNADCDRFNFIPIRCLHCDKIFCQHHITSKHVCEIIPKIKTVGNILKVYKCSLEFCQETEYLEIVCQCCKLGFCLNHLRCKSHFCIVCKANKNTTKTYVIDTKLVEIKS